jgi:hypothetical protein
MEGEQEGASVSKIVSALSTHLPIKSQWCQLGSTGCTGEKSPVWRVEFAIVQSKVLASQSTLQASTLISPQS